MVLSCRIISNNTIAEKEEIIIVKIVPTIPRKLPMAAISFMSPPPKDSRFINLSKAILVIQKRKKPKAVPITASTNFRSDAGNREKSKPIKSKGKEITSGMIL